MQNYLAYRFYPNRIRAFESVANGRSLPWLTPSNPQYIIVNIPCIIFVYSNFLRRQTGAPLLFSCHLFQSHTHQLSIHNRCDAFSNSHMQSVVSIYILKISPKYKPESSSSSSLQLARTEPNRTTHDLSSPG